MRQALTRECTQKPSMMSIKVVDLICSRHAGVGNHTGTSSELQLKLRPRFTLAFFAQTFSQTAWKTMRHTHRSADGHPWPLYTLTSGRRGTAGPVPVQCSKTPPWARKSEKAFPGKKAFPFPPLPPPQEEIKYSTQIHYWGGNPDLCLTEGKSHWGSGQHFLRPSRCSFLQALIYYWDGPGVSPQLGH